MNCMFFICLQRVELRYSFQELFYSCTTALIHLRLNDQLSFAGAASQVISMQLATRFWTCCVQLLSFPVLLPFQAVHINRVKYKKYISFDIDLRQKRCCIPVYLKCDSFIKNDAYASNMLFWNNFRLMNT